MTVSPPLPLPPPPEKMVIGGSQFSHTFAKFRSRARFSAQRKLESIKRALQALPRIALLHIALLHIALLHIASRRNASHCRALRRSWRRPRFCRLPLRLGAEPNAVAHFDVIKCAPIPLHRASAVLNEFITDAARKRRHGRQPLRNPAQSATQSRQTDTPHEARHKTPRKDRHCFALCRPQRTNHKARVSSAANAPVALVMNAQ